MVVECREGARQRIGRLADLCVHTDLAGFGDIQAITSKCLLFHCFTALPHKLSTSNRSSSGKLFEVLGWLACSRSIGTPVERHAGQRASIANNVLNCRRSKPSQGSASIDAVRALKCLLHNGKDHATAVQNEPHRLNQPPPFVVDPLDIGGNQRALGQPAPSIVRALYPFTSTTPLPLIQSTITSDKHPFPHTSDAVAC